MYEHKICTIKELFEIVLELNSNNEYWFRGHSNDAYRLVPSAYRELYVIEDCYERPICPRLMTGTDNGRGDRVYIPAREYKKAYFAKLDELEVPYEKNLGIVDEFCLAQHYGLPTPMLDWTTDLSVALFFACCNNKDENDAALFLLNPIKWNKLANGNERILNAKEVEYIQSFFPTAMFGKPFEKRVCRQSGNFVVFGLNVQEMDALNVKDDTILIKIVIPNAMAQKLSQMLHAAGINDNSIYVGEDDKDLIATDVIKETNETVVKEFLEERKRIWEETPENDRGISYHVVGL